MVVLPPLVQTRRDYSHARNRKLYPDRKPRNQPITYRTPQPRPSVPAPTRLSLDDVVSMAEHAREVTSQQSRRLVLEEAHKAMRYEGSLLDRSRPHSVVGPGLQAFTSPMPSPCRTPGQMDHIPSLLPLPSDRTFIPSPDQHHDRHVTNTPTEYFRLDDDCRHHPVARQCCEIMGPSLCRSCRRLESRAQNRKNAELECPRMRSAGGRGRLTFSLTQVVKRSYPRLSDAEIQDKLARGEIARMPFPMGSRRYNDDDDDDDVRNRKCFSSMESSVVDKDHDSCDEREDEDEEEEEEEDKDILHVDPASYRATTPSSRPESSNANGGSEGNSSSKANNNGTTISNNNTSNSGHLARQHLTKASLSTGNAFYVLARLALRLQGETTTPLFFSDLRRMQDKILSGTVDRKAYMTLRPDVTRQQQNQHGDGPPHRLKSAVSSVSTSSGKSGLSKFGSQLSKEFMPAFVSPRKVKLIEEPKYKVYFEPPLLTKRRQIPNPSFFAGSTDEYSLPERLPDVIEFADSQRIAALEKQIRSGSALSFVSSMSDEQQQQQQQALSMSGDQEKLSSLPLDESSGRGGLEGDGGLPSGRGVSTPRSLHRVSSGGPLSARTVPEENEEEMQKELAGNENPKTTDTEGGGCGQMSDIKEEEKEHTEKQEGSSATEKARQKDPEVDLNTRHTDSTSCRIATDQTSVSETSVIQSGETEACETNAMTNTNVPVGDGHTSNAVINRVDRPTPASLSNKERSETSVEHSLMSSELEARSKDQLSSADQGADVTSSAFFLTIRESTERLDSCGNVQLEKPGSVDGHGCDEEEDENNNNDNIDGELGDCQKHDENEGVDAYDGDDTNVDENKVEDVDDGDGIDGNDVGVVGDGGDIENSDESDNDSDGHDRDANDYDEGCESYTDQQASCDQ